MRIALLVAVLLVLPIAAASADSSGRVLLFTAGGGGGPDVFSSTADGGDWLSLTGGAGHAFDPAWSPDGLRIAFASNVDSKGTGSAGIYVVGADGGSLARLTSDPRGPTESAPTWSPDEASLAYLANDSGAVDVWTVPVAGGSPRRLTTSGGQKIGLAWSPSASRLLTTEATSSSQPVLVVDAVTGAETKLADGRSPAWSPDGTRIAYLDAAGRA